MSMRVDTFRYKNIMIQHENIILARSTFASKEVGESAYQCATNLNQDKIAYY